MLDQRLAACALGVKLAQANLTVVIEVFLRERSLGGRHVHTGLAWWGW